MADDVAMKFRRSRSQPQPAPAAGAGSGLSTVLLVAVAAAVGFAGYTVLAPGGGPGETVFGRLAAMRPSVPAAAPAAPGPRVLSAVSGVREFESASLTGLSPATGELAQSYVPVGPVVIRTERSFVEVDGARLIPPPAGPQRTGRAVLDHAARLAAELRALAATPCDRHLRHLAAANVNLFVAGFMPPRAPVRTAAAPDAAFWSRPEASMVRRAVAELAEKGALAPADFGLDTSPEVKGLFQGLQTARPACG